jgi:hypothetical protein
MSDLVERITKYLSETADDPMEYRYGTDVALLKEAADRLATVERERDAMKAEVAEWLRIATVEAETSRSDKAYWAGRASAFRDVQLLQGDKA